MNAQPTAQRETNGPGSERDCFSSARLCARALNQAARASKRSRLDVRSGARGDTSQAAAVTRACCVRLCWCAKYLFERSVRTQCSGASCFTVAPKQVVKAVAVIVHLGVQLTRGHQLRCNALGDVASRTSRHKKYTASTVHSPSGGTPAVWYLPQRAGVR